jgi:hypothetical protein
LKTIIDGSTQPNPPVASCPHLAEAPRTILGHGVASPGATSLPLFSTDGERFPTRPWCVHSASARGSPRLAPTPSSLAPPLPKSRPTLGPTAWPGGHGARPGAAHNQRPVAHGQRGQHGAQLPGSPPGRGSRRLSLSFSPSLLSCR